jgi:hypothetical protein
MRGAVAHVIDGTVTERRVVIVEFPSLTARRRGTAAQYRRRAGFVRPCSKRSPQL